jgi:hypothetical protein
VIHLPASVRVYLCLTACDMRKSFDSLHALVRDWNWTPTQATSSCSRAGGGIA